MHHIRLVARWSNRKLAKLIAATIHAKLDQYEP